MAVAVAAAVAVEQVAIIGEVEVLSLRGDHEATADSHIRILTSDLREGQATIALQMKSSWFQ